MGFESSNQAFVCFSGQAVHFIKFVSPKQFELVPPFVFRGGRKKLA